MLVLICYVMTHYIHIFICCISCFFCVWCSTIFIECVWNLTALCNVQLPNNFTSSVIHVEIMYFCRYWHFLFELLIWPPYMDSVFTCWKIGWFFLFNLCIMVHACVIYVDCSGCSWIKYLCTCTLCVSSYLTSISAVGFNFLTWWWAIT